MCNNYNPLPSRLEVLEFIIPFEFGLMKNAKSEAQLRFLINAQRAHLNEYKNITGKSYSSN
jgi:hypothetical protein